MSYILEALASSEQARQQVPDAPKYSLLPVVGEEAPRRRLWPYAAAALAANAVVLYFLARPTLLDSGRTVKAVASPAQQATVEPQMRPSSIPGSEIPSVAAERTLSQAPPPRPQPQRVTEPVVARAQEPAGAPAKAQARKRELQVVEPKKPGAAVKAPPAPADPAPAASTPPAAPIPVAAAPVRTEAAPAPRESGSRGELPSGVQREVPALSVSGFIREEGSSGFVIVNDRLLREGDELAPGLKLEKILQDSVVFDYKGYRFRP
jgi:general secretion pathway protein B